VLARVLLREHERERQAWERERARLIETICHLAGQPLESELVLPVLPAEPDEAERLGLVPDPGQLPDY
jgi:hypothetical protein